MNGLLKCPYISEDYDKIIVITQVQGFTVQRCRIVFLEIVNKSMNGGAL
jgi:hypothetical protein